LGYKSRVDTRADRSLSVPWVRRLSHGTLTIKKFILISLLFFLTFSASAQDVVDGLGIDNANTSSDVTNPFGDLDPSQWQDYYDAPDGVTGCPNPEHCENILDLLGNSSDVDVEAYRESLDGFLDRSDPLSVVGGSLGIDAYCEPETGEIIQDVEVVEDYSCHSTFETDDVLSTCNIPMNVRVDEDYLYSCNVPNSSVCTSIMEGAHYFKVRFIFGDNFHQYSSGAGTQPVVRSRDYYEFSRCMVTNIQNVHQFTDVVDYRCTDSDPDFGQLGDVFVLEQHANCTSTACEALEENGDCRPYGDEYCEEQGASNESLSCVPNGQEVDGLECERRRIHELEVRFSYDCNYTLDANTGELVPDGKCEDLLSDDSCSQGQQECVDRQDLEYSETVCEVGENVSYNNETCSLVRHGIGFQEFLYIGKSSFDHASGNFLNDEANNILSSNDACRSLEETCVVEAPEVFEESICKEGYQDLDTSYDCSINREITVDEDYIYGTRRTWDGQNKEHVSVDNFGSILDDICISQGEICEIATPPVYEEHVCLQGYRLNASNETCNLDRVVIVDTDYGYLGKEVYFEDYEGSEEEVLFVRDQIYNEAVASECSEISRECIVERPLQYENLVCQEGYSYNSEIVSISRPLLVEVETDYYYRGYNSYVEGVGFSKDSELLSLESDNACFLETKTCVEESAGIFSSHECRHGYSETYSNLKCEADVVVGTESNYIYHASESWNTTGFLPDSELISLRNNNSCVRQSRLCVKDSPGIFEGYTCTTGYIRSYEEKKFRRTGEPVYDFDYIYDGLRTWNGSVHAKDAASNSLGSDSECEIQSTSCSVVTPPPFSTYTCTQGYSDVTSAVSCERQKIVTVDLDYTYTVNRAWNYSTNKWTGLSDWNAVRSGAGQQAQCIKQSGTCSTDSPGVYTDHTCQQGYRIDGENMSCSKTLNYTTETDYRYVGYEHIAGRSVTRDPTLVNIDRQKGSKSCVRESVVNQLPLSSAQRTSTYECVKGSITYGDEATCDISLSVQITGSVKYELRKNPIYSGYYSQAQSISSSVWTSKGCSLTSSGTISYANIRWYKVSCPKVTSFGNSPDSTQLISNTLSEQDSWNTSACNALASSGTLKSTVCVGGGATRTVSGQSVYRSCWKKRRTYTTEKVVSVNSCRPPSGFSYKSQTNYTGSPALGDKRSLKLLKYAKVETLSNSDKKVSAFHCFTGYWVNNSGSRVNYSCSVPSGASRKSSVCAWRDGAGRCRLLARSYTVPSPGAIGGYQRRKETWKCDKVVTGSGVSSPTLIRSRKSWVWENDECPNSVASYSNGCVLSSAGYVGPNVSKTVDGLTIKRQWEYERRYVCQQKINIDTCSSLLAQSDNTEKYVKYASVGGNSYLRNDAYSKNVPQYQLGDVYSITPDVQQSGNGINSPPIGKYAGLGDWTPNGQTCLNYEGSTCTLWSKNYRREERDLSGGCAVQSEEWKCENTIANAGTPVISRHIESEKWEWPSSDCTAKTSEYDSCRYINHTFDSDNGGVRYINGLKVSRSHWVADRNYECVKREYTDTCSPPSDASVNNVSCNWTDTNGICRLSEYEYKIPKNDPTGGCTTFTDSYLCERNNHGTPVSSIKEFSHLSFPVSSEQTSAINDNSCTRTEHNWSGGRAERVVDGIKTYPASNQQWNIDTTYRCHADEHINTCDVPANSTLVSSQCESTIDGGGCSLFLNNYSVELPDPSGGCHEWQEEFLCEGLVGNAGNPVAIPSSEVTDGLNFSMCTALENNSTCQFVESTCIEGESTKIINGISVTRSCWKWDRQYECSSVNEINTCAPKPTAVLDEETCAWHDRDGVCRLFDRVYVNEEHDPSGGCAKEEHTYICDNEKEGLSYYDTRKTVKSQVYDLNPYLEMIDEFRGCTYVSGSATYEDHETRIVDGLSLTRYWSRDYEYDCYNREQVNTCDYPEGAILGERVCAQEFRGACVLYDYPYSAPIPDDSGGCSEYETQFKCDNELGGYTSNQEWKSIESEKYDRALCDQKIEEFNSCRFLGESCREGHGTRNIDGLSVTRECWSLEREYTCDEVERFDTCTIPSTAINLNTECAWLDGGGTCRLFENVFDVVLPDETNGCTTYLEKFRCEEPLSGPVLLDNPKHVIADVWNDSQCEKDDDGSICTVDTLCSSGPETRIIDGLEVSRSCWEKQQNHTCSKRESHDECTQYTTYDTIDENCLWEDGQGICRLYERSFDTPVEDASSGCHVWENSYWCGAEQEGLSSIRDHITVTSTIFDNSECLPLAQSEGAYLDNKICIDTGVSPRAPSVVKHRENGGSLIFGPNTTVDEISEECWVEERVFSLETREHVNSCVGKITSTCQLEDSSCIGTRERNGECAKEEFRYTCGIEGSDACLVEENTFSCLGPAIASSAQLSNLNGNLSGYEPSNIEASVNRTYWDNTVCNNKTDFGLCTLVDTICDDESNGDRRPVLYAQDEYFQQFVGLAPKQSHTCWNQKQVYNCTAPENVGYCENRSEGCVLSGTLCLTKDITGECLMDINLYSCSNDTTGECSSTSQGYVCENLVEGEEVSGELPPEITSEYDLTSCENIDRQTETCLEPETVCSDDGGIRYYEPVDSSSDSTSVWSDFGLSETSTSVPVESECWNYERTYKCSEIGERVSDCEVEDNCEKISDKCLGNSPDGECLTTEHNYVCTRTETEVLAEGKLGTCENSSNSVPHSPSNGPNQSISALASLVGMAQADRETSGSSVTIFDGTDKRCGRSVGGIKNCCRDSGVLLSLGFGTCDNEAIELAVQKEENRCVHVGSYCSKKAFFGTCLKKKQTYCCFQAEIGKVITEAGREQMGMDWGTPKNPDCSGFTVEEFQQINLENVDWSSVSADIMKDLDIGDTSSLQDQLTNSINNMIDGEGR